MLEIRLSLAFLDPKSHAICLLLVRTGTGITGLVHSLACYNNVQIREITHRHDSLGHTQSQRKLSNTHLVAATSV